MRRQCRDILWHFYFKNRNDLQSASDEQYETVLQIVSFRLKY